MASEDNNNFLWFLGGVAVGTGVALLMAPEAGEGTRRKLVTQARKSSQLLSESGQDIYQRGRELYEKGREIAEEAAELFERGRHLAEDKIDEVI
jgi:gas vesicle protein